MDNAIDSAIKVLEENLGKISYTRFDFLDEDGKNCGNEVRKGDIELLNEWKEQDVGIGDDFIFDFLIHANFYPAAPDDVECNKVCKLLLEAATGSYTPLDEDDWQDVAG